MSFFQKKIKKSQNYYKIIIEFKNLKTITKTKMCRKNSFCPKCHGNIGETVQARSLLVDWLNNKPFVYAVTLNSTLKQVREMYRGKKQLISDKYDVKLKTFALNEMLGRPVPIVIDLDVIHVEAINGRFTSLDKALGFIDNDGKEVEMIPLEQQQRMNDIMINILKAQGLDFDAFIAETSSIHLELLEIHFKNERKEKKQKISKMKLQNQRKLGAVAKPVQTKSGIEADKKENGDSDSGKIKTAKDHEHYRKSKRPTRI